MRASLCKSVDGSMSSSNTKPHKAQTCHSCCASTGGIDRSTPPPPLCTAAASRTGAATRAATFAACPMGPSGVALTHVQSAPATPSPTTLDPQSINTIHWNRTTTGRAHAESARCQVASLATPNKSAAIHSCCSLHPPEIKGERKEMSINIQMNHLVLLGHILHGQEVIAQVLTRPMFVNGIRSAHAS
jgi:hypothetical protein